MFIEIIRLLLLRHDNIPLTPHETKIRLAGNVAKILSTNPEIKPKLAKVILFGSVARNQDNPDSDIDILATYAGIPTSRNDELFHDQIISVLENEGVKLGDPTQQKAMNTGCITIQTMPQEVLDHPDLYLDIFQIRISAVIKNIQREGIELYHKKRF